MDFFYKPVLSRSPETGDPTLILRPVIQVRIIGPGGSGDYAALVDTGSDNCLLPKRIADDLRISLTTGRGPRVTTFSGQQVDTSFGDVVFELSDGTEVFRWPARVQFFDFPTPDDESLALGHEGFLDYFSATFDVFNGRLTLVPNSELPRIP